MCSVVPDVAWAIRIKASTSLAVSDAVALTAVIHNIIATLNYLIDELRECVYPRDATEIQQHKDLMAALYDDLQRANRVPYFTKQMYFTREEAAIRPRCMILEWRGGIPLAHAVAQRPNAIRQAVITLQAVLAHAEDQGEVGSHQAQQWIQ